MTISAVQNVKKSTVTKSNVASAGFDIPSAPPVMQLRSKNFRRNSLRSAAPPTPEQADFAEIKSWTPRPGGTQNPPVLLPPETVCSARKHPLSNVSGRGRYNTLDFPTENRVPTGRFHPYWKPRINGICHPFEIPARLRICTHKQKKRVCDYRSINAKNPTAIPPKRRGKTVGFLLCRIHWNGRNSCVAYRCGGAFFGTLTRVPAREY